MLIHCIIIENQFAATCCAEEQCKLQGYKWEVGDDKGNKVVWICKGWVETDSDEAVWCCANFINPTEQNLFTNVKLLRIYSLGESLENKEWHQQASGGSCLIFSKDLLYRSLLWLLQKSKCWWIVIFPNLFLQVRNKFHVSKINLGLKKITRCLF